MFIKLEFEKDIGIVLDALISRKLHMELTLKYMVQHNFHDDAIKLYEGKLLNIQRVIDKVSKE